MATIRLRALVCCVLQVFVAPQPAANLAGWGNAVGTAKVQAASTSVDLKKTRGGAVLVWITNLGPSQQVRIAEVTVNGRAAQ